MAESTAVKLVVEGAVMDLVSTEMGDGNRVCQ